MTSQLPKLGSFLGTNQALTLFDCLKGEERGYFVTVLNEMLDLISKMPKTYETDGQGKDAVAVLHYFVGGCDWYITEKDMEDEQLQAFGLANLGYGAELGYINIQEITKAGAKLDLHWTPKPLKEIK
jgi:hypothetical protein